MVHNMELPAKFFRTRPIVAREKNCPVYFKGTILKETAKAVYVYGYGHIDPEVRCARCGRELTNPVSKEVGIGPECIKHWGLGNMPMDETTTDEQKEVMRQTLYGKTIDSWFPRSVLIITDSDGTIEVPGDHNMLTNSKAKQESMAKADGDIIKVYFEPVADLLSKVKSMSYRRFNIEGKYWTVPVSIDNIRSLKEWGFRLDDSLTVILEQASKSVEEMEAVTIKGLKRSLYPFQARGVAFLEHRKGRAIIGDDMGLGKTVQALAYLQAHPELTPAIIVTPAAVKYNWLNEAKAWMSDDRTFQVLEGKTPYEVDCEDILIINYDIISGWWKYLAKLSPKVMVLDECHAIMNNTAARTKAVKMLAKSIPHVIPMSGTPIINRPRELYNAIHLVEPTLFPSFWNYAQKYCGAKHNGFGWNFNGATNMEELYGKLQGVMIRRKKDEVLTELPAKQRSYIPIEISNRKEYAKAENDFLGWVKSAKGEGAAKKASNAETLAQISALRYLAAKGALKQSIEWVEEFLHATTHKLVVFAIHKEIVDELMERFADVAVKIDGGVPAKKRPEVVDAFQNDPKVRLFVGNINAAGVGITLTAAHNVAFIELPWTPGLLDQAEDRCNRIGQKNAVNVWYLIPKDTIEEQLAKVIDEKREVITAVLDGEEIEETSMLTALIESFDNKKSA